MGDGIVRKERQSLRGRALAGGAAVLLVGVLGWLLLRPPEARPPEAPVPEAKQPAATPPAPPPRERAIAKAIAAAPPPPAAPQRPATAPTPAATAATPAAPAEATMTDGGPGEGIAAFPPPGTKPIKRGLVVPDGFVLPEGFVRHTQTTDEGVQLPPILMFHPDKRPPGAPEDNVVPPELAPPGMPIKLLDLPDHDR